MRICLITSVPFPPEEGLGYHVWNLAEQLQQHRHQVTIITRGGVGPSTQEQQKGIAIWRIPFIPVYPFHVHLHSFFVNQLRGKLEAQFDVINEHTPLPPVIDTTVPIVTSVHSPMRADTAATVGVDLHTLLIHLQTPVSQRIETAILHRSKKITAVAAWVAEALQPYGINPAEVIVTGNGVEACFFERPTVQQRDPLVLYAGRLEPGKGLPELVKAAKIILNRHPEFAVRFVIAGKGSLLPKIRGMVNQAGLQNHFDFRGHFGPEQRSELVQLYKKASIFVLPSHHEGMPTVLLEAMASGLPVVSTAVGGALELITDGQNGMLIPPGDPERLAQTLLTLLADPKLRLDFTRKARATVENRYSWRAVTERYLMCYEQALKGSRIKV